MQRSAELHRDCHMVIEALDGWPRRSHPEVKRHFQRHQPVLIIAEGSSQLIPGAFIQACARMWGWPGSIHVIGGREASQLPLREFHVILISNSGRTRELVDLLPILPASATAILGSRNGPLGSLDHVVVLPRPECSVPATASVFTTCLTLGQALAEACDMPLPIHELQHGVQAMLTAPTAHALPASRHIYWAGRNAGLCEELALKTVEMCGSHGVALPGSLAMHGIHEVIGADDCVVGFDIHHDDTVELRRRIETIGGGTLITPDVPHLGAWTCLLQLVHGWRLLEDMAYTIGRNPAFPVRARKVGYACLSASV